MTPREHLRDKMALACLTAGTVGTVTYAALRMWVYARGGGAHAVLILRQQTIGYFQALGVSAVVAISVGLAQMALATDPDSLERARCVLLRGVAPAVLISGVAFYLLP